MEATGNGQALDTRAETVIDLLDRHLATAIDLQLRIKHLLWNAEDPQITETWWLCNAAREFEMFGELIAERLRSAPLHKQHRKMFRRRPGAVISDTAWARPTP